MYRILCDNTLLCDSRIDELALIEPIVELEENRAGSFSFTIPPEHPRYDLIKQRKSVLEVYQDDELIFCGVCVEISKDFFNQKSVVCEGELTYFNDSVQRPARYQNITVRALLQAYINNHNAQVDDYKKFAVGIVTVSDPNDSLYCYTNMESTMECLQKDLVEDLGGFFRIRHKDGTRYLDYLADSQNTSTQVIRLGENLMDFTSNISLMDIATAVIPLGVTLETTPIEGLEVKLTIADANNGCDYIYNQEAVDNYGWIYKTIEFNNVNSAEILKTKAKKYLTDIQFDNMVIEASAIDLHLVDEVVESFKLSDNIRVVSRVHGLDRYFRLTKMKICLSKPENNVITLGKDAKPGLSSKTVEISDEIKKLMENEINPSEILNHAKDNATELITNAMNGFVYKTHDELFIMDTDNPETATRVWRWNINGLGYSSSGIKGPYGLAMTMDGRIVADYIATGTMSADRVKGGIFEVGGTGYGKDGKIEVKNAEGTTLITLDKNGMTLAAGQKISWNNISNAPSIPSKMSDLTNDEQYVTKKDIPDVSQYVDEKTATIIAKDQIKAATIYTNQIESNGGNIAGWSITNKALYKNKDYIAGKDGAYLSTDGFSLSDYFAVAKDGIWQKSINFVPKQYERKESYYTHDYFGYQKSDTGYIRFFFINVPENEWSGVEATVTCHGTAKADDGAAISGYLFAKSFIKNFRTSALKPVYDCPDNDSLFYDTETNTNLYTIDINLESLKMVGNGTFTSGGKTYRYDPANDVTHWNINYIYNGVYGTRLQVYKIEMNLGGRITVFNGNLVCREKGTLFSTKNNCIRTEDTVIDTDGITLYDSAIIKGIQTENENQSSYRQTKIYELSNDILYHNGLAKSSAGQTLKWNNGEFNIASSSSRRYKEKITQNINDELNPHRLYDVNIYQFKYKDDYLNKHDERYDKEFIGLIAEDLHEKYPFVCDMAEGVPESPNYELMIAPMLKLIQEQNERLKKLEKEILKDDEY